MNTIDSGANRNRVFGTSRPDRPASSRCRRRPMPLLAAPVVVVSITLFAPPLMAQPTVVSAASYESAIARKSLTPLFGSNLAPSRGPVRNTECCRSVGCPDVATSLVTVSSTAPASFSTDAGGKGFRAEARRRFYVGVP